MRLRSTALPTCFDTVNPTRTGPSSARRRACNTNALAEALTPVDAARKSVRRVNRSMATTEKTPRSRTEPLTPVRTPRRKHPATALRRHPGAKAVAALAHQFARLVGPFHGICLRCAPRPRPARRSATLSAKSMPREFRCRVNSVCQRAIGAAYTKALPARQCDRTDTLDWRNNPCAPRRFPKCRFPLYRGVLSMCDGTETSGNASAMCSHEDPALVPVIVWYLRMRRAAASAG